MKNIMFICTGNICRSAMAEWELKNKVEELKKDIKVYSCGVYAENGQAATNEAIKAMEEYGVDLKKHKSTNIKNSKINDMDLILCATFSHKINVIYMYPDLKQKIYTLKEYVEYSKDESNLDIKDPYGFDIETYRNCAKEIIECINLLIGRI